MKHKPYSNLESLPIPTYRGKDLLIDFITGFSISINWKGKAYDFDLIIIDWLPKMLYYEPVKIIINASKLVEIIIDVIIKNHGLSNSILTNRGTLFILKLWSSLCYLVTIKRRLSIAFYPQTNGLTK